MFQCFTFTSWTCLRNKLFRMTSFAVVLKHLFWKAKIVISESLFRSTLVSFGMVVSEAINALWKTLFESKNSHYRKPILECICCFWNDHSRKSFFITPFLERINSYYGKLVLECTCCFQNGLFVNPINFRKPSFWNLKLFLLMRNSF